MSITLPKDIKLPQTGIGSALGSALGQGLGQMAKLGLSDMIKTNNSLLNAEKNIGSDITKSLHNLNIKDLDTETIQNLQNRAKELLKSTKDPRSADYAVQEYLIKQQQEARKAAVKEEEDLAKNRPFLQRGMVESGTESGANLPDQLAKLLGFSSIEGLKQKLNLPKTSGPTESGATLGLSQTGGGPLAQFIMKGIQGLNQAGKQTLPTTQGPKETGQTLGLGEPLETGLLTSALGEVAGGMDNKEFVKRSLKDKTFLQNLAQGVGQFAGDLPFIKMGGFSVANAVRTYAREVANTLSDPDRAKLFNGGQAASNIIKETIKGAALDKFFKGIPSLSDDIANIPGAKKLMENAFAKQVTDIVLEGSTIATVPSLLEGKLPTGEDFAQGLAFALGFKATGLPKALRQNIDSKIKTGKINLSRETGYTPETFAQEVKTRSQEVGIDEAKLQSGDKTEINKLNRVINDMTKEPTVQAKKVAETQAESGKPKISKEELIKAKTKETKLVKKVSESPLEEYFPEEREKRPETIIKEEMRTEPLKTELESITNRIKETGTEIEHLRSNLRNATQETKSAIQDKLDRKLNTRDTLLEKRRALNSEIKFGKKPPSESELTAQIDTALENIRQEAKDPESVDPKKIQRQEELFQKAKALADRIVKRGELQKQNDLDTFFRIKEAYNQSYKDMLKINNDMIDFYKRSNKTDKVSQLNRMNDILNKRIAKNEVDQVKIRDKRAVEKLTKGARGAFFRQALGELRKDIGIFRNQSFRQQKLKTAESFKTESVFKKTIESVINDPIKAKAEAENAGLNYETGKKIAEKVSKELSEKDSLSSEEIKKGMEDIRSGLEGKSREGGKKQDPKSKAKLGYALGYGLLRESLKRVGITLPTRGVSSILSGKVFKPTVGTILALTSLASVQYNKAKKALRVSEFRKILRSKNIVTIQNYEKELAKKGYTKGQITGLRNKAKARL